VLHTTSVLSQKGIDLMDTSKGPLMNRPGGGSSAVYGPDGRQLSDDIPETEEEEEVQLARKLYHSYLCNSICQMVLQFFHPKVPFLLGGHKY
jgi:hypothetical protein